MNTATKIRVMCVTTTRWCARRHGHHRHAVGHDHGRGGSVGREAIEQHHRSKPDVTLMDFQLPDMRRLRCDPRDPEGSPTQRSSCSAHTRAIDVRRAMMRRARYVAKAWFVTNCSPSFVVCTPASGAFLPNAAALAEHVADDLLSERGSSVTTRVGRKIEQEIAPNFRSPRNGKMHVGNILSKLESATGPKRSMSRCARHHPSVSLPASESSGPRVIHRRFAPW